MATPSYDLPMSGEVWLILGGFAAFIAIAVLIGNARDRRAGTGYYTHYGPNPTKERIAHVDTARSLFREGAVAMRDGSTDKAKQIWQRSSDMGCIEAITGLGVVEYRSGRKEEARGHWARASAAGDIPARLLLRIRGDSYFDFGVRELVTAYITSESVRNRYDIDSLFLMAGVAGHYGYTEYAGKAADRGRHLESQYGQAPSARDL